jgi:multiple sugar transport system permease protein
MTTLALSPRTRKRLTQRGLDALTWLVLAIMLAPVFWLVASSLQTEGQLATGSYDLLHPTFKAFGEMWRRINFTHYFVNSLIICGVASALATSFAASAGYALARYRFRGAKSFSLGVIGTQLIPGSMFLLPVFMGMIWLGKHTPIHLFDTRTGMILVYTAFFTPVSIYFMRSFFQAIPRDL